MNSKEHNSVKKYVSRYHDLTIEFSTSNKVFMNMTSLANELWSEKNDFKMQVVKPSDRTVNRPYK